MPSPTDSERALRDAFPSLAARAGADLPRLAAEAARLDVEAGTVILAEGEEHDSLFLVCRGEVALECESAGARVQIGTLGKGRWFGEIGFLEAGVSTASVSSTGPTLLLAVPRAQFLGYFDSDPVLAEAILNEILPGMSQRLRTTRELVDRGAEPLTDTDQPTESRFVRALRAFFGGGA